MKVRIKWEEKNKHVGICLVSGESFEKFHLLPEKQYWLHLGQQSCEVFVRPSAESNQFILLCSDSFISGLTADERSVYEDIELNFWVRNDQIYLGPVLGIFTRPDQLRVPGEFSTFINHMRAGQKRNFLCYYFSFNSIEWDVERVRGYTFIPGKKKWVYAWFPMPDIIYDRGAGFSKEQKKSVKETRAIIRNKTKVQFINNRDYFGKWSLYQGLSKYKKIARYLPQTVSYDGIETVLSMLEKYDLLFLKSYYGSHGKQVLSIRKTIAGYKLVYYKKGLKEQEVKDLEQLKTQLNHFIGSKKFIVQQGIQLLHYNNRLFDMRVLMIKDKNGKWMVISNYARIAEEGFTITNYSTGGECDFYSNLYPYLCSFYSDLTIPDNDQIAKAALMIAEAVETEFGRVGELGLDLAVDIYGRLWLIEVNSKPNKDLVMSIDDFSDVHPQYLAIFDYAGYLCGLPT